ncbi:MAG: hypothetical protein IKL70_02405 [Oscillospiraceae bacterium]|nr:hypothetical protein [Oscillospiraceae bacterium]
MSEEIRQFDQADVEANKTFSILIVIFNFLFFLPLVMEDKKGSAYLKYYANQALIAFLFGFIPPLGTICWIILLVGILNGSYMSIPLVGDKLEIIK